MPKKKKAISSTRSILLLEYSLSFFIVILLAGLLSILYLQYKENKLNQPEVSSPEPMLLEHMEKEGVITSRKNGKDISENLLSKQGRHYNSIVYYDNKDYLIDPKEYANWKHTEVKIFQPQLVERSPVLKNHAELGIRLLRGLSFNVLWPSEVFEADTMGKFIAIAELWKSPQSLHWSNLHFYVNPHSLKLEPIALTTVSDSALEYSQSIVTLPRSNFINYLFHDPRILAAYKKYLEKFTSASYLKDYLNLSEAELKKIEKRARYLHRNIPERIDRLKDKRRPDTIPREYESSVIYGFIGQKNDMAPYLELFNPLSKPVEVTSIKYSIGKTKDSSKYFDENFILPIPLMPDKFDHPPKSVRLDINWDIYNATFKGTARVDGKDYPFIFKRYFDCLPDEFPVDWTPKRVQQDYPFLTWHNEGYFSSVPGKYKMNKPFKLPEEVIGADKKTRFPRPGLVLEAGTEITFGKDSYLRIYGPLTIKGEKDKPVVLTAKEGSTWGGITVINAGTASSISNALFRGLTTPKDKYLHPTTSITFYKSDVDITDSQFVDFDSSAALNMVHSNINISNSSFADITGNPVYCDFCTGDLSGVNFPQR